MEDYCYQWPDGVAGSIEAPAPPTEQVSSAPPFLWNDARLDEILRSMGSMKPCGSTGLPLLDEILGGGLYPEVYVIAAEPGAGKTTLVLQIADYVATYGNRKVVFVSEEMSDLQIVAKSLSRINMERKTYPPLSIRDVMRMDAKNLDAIKAAADAYRTETAPSIATIDEKLTALDIERLYADLYQAGEDMPLLVVDYLQIMPNNDDVARSDYQHHTANMRTLVGISKTYRTPVLVVSSKNRTARKGNGLEGLSGSSEIEYGAAVVMFLIVDGKDEIEIDANRNRPSRPVSLIVRKNRFGACGRVPLVFQAPENRFIQCDE